MPIPPFHLAIPVDDLERARWFYGEVLQCPQGRSADHWIDFNLSGHQLVVHQVPQGSRVAKERNPVDGQQVPVPHFGLVLDWSDWEALAQRLRDHDLVFEIPPTVRFAGQPGEQGTFFLYDPAGNALEFKAMRNSEDLFRR